MLDKATGLGWAGGYVGHGVTATNLAGRTLADLVLDRRTPLTELPWVGHRSRNWEPEPLRWLGVRGMYLAYKAADWHESRGLGHRRRRRSRSSPTGSRAVPSVSRGFGLLPSAAAACALMCSALAALRSFTPVAQPAGMRNQPGRRSQVRSVTRQPPSPVGAMS